MGKGQYVRLGFSGSLERAQVDFSFTEPHFLDRNLAAGFDLFHKEVDLTNVASFRERDTGGDLRLGFPIADNTQLGLRYKFEREEIYDVADNASLAVKEAEGVVQRLERRLHRRLRHPQSSAIADQRRLRLLLAGPRRRRRRCELFQVRSSMRAATIPLTNKITLVGRVQGGYIDGWGGQDVRMTDLFFKGGETIRGFRARRLRSRATLARTRLPASA